MFEVSGLDKYYVEEEMVHSGLAGKMDDVFKKMQTEGQWPLGTSGQLAFAEKQHGVETFINKVHEQQMGARCSDVPFDFVCRELSSHWGRCPMCMKTGSCWSLWQAAGTRSPVGLDPPSGIGHLVPSAKTRIVAMDTVIGFNDAAEGPDLEMLLNHFAAGCQAPSCFLSNRPLPMPDS